MGVDPAPQMANLYLYYYEAAFMEKLTKQDYSKAKKFTNTSRFIDDLGTLINDGILVTEKAKIYPVELVLNFKIAVSEELLSDWCETKRKQIS